VAAPKRIQASQASRHWQIWQGSLATMACLTLLDLGSDVDLKINAAKSIVDTLAVATPTSPFGWDMSMDFRA
jgi:hypothetical protein